MSFPVFGRRKPHDFREPPEVERLPFTLLRDALTTRDPELVASAIEAYENAEAERDLYDPPEGPFPLPQKMQFQQWKTPPMTGFANRPDHADPYASAASLMRARADLLQQRLELIHANNPETYPIERAGFDRRGSSKYVPVDTREVLFRDAPAGGRPIHPYPGENYAEEMLETDEELGPFVNQDQGVQRSLSEIRSIQAHFVGLLLNNVRGRR